MLPNFDPFRSGRLPVVRAAGLAEEIGFDSGWVGDHLAFHPPILEAACALSAAAARTERLRLGFGVMLLALRPPVWVAKQLGAIDALAPGRLLFGVGVGGENPAEWEAAGVPVTERGRRVDEALEVLPQLLAGQPVDYRGRYVQVRAPALEPAPREMPPVVVGGRSEAAIRRAARYGDAWLPVWLDAERVAARRAQLASLASELGRAEPETIMLAFACVTDDVARAREKAAALMAGQYRLPFERVERWCPIGDADHVAGVLETYRDVGAGGFLLVPLSDEPLEQIERFAAVRDRISATRAAT